MNSLFLHSSLIPSLTYKFLPRPHIQSLHTRVVYDSHSIHCSFPLFVSFPCISQPSLLACNSSQVDATIPSEEGAVSLVNFEDFNEKDWSFLDSDDLNANEERNQKINRIISSGGIEENSMVVASLASEGFVDQLVNTMTCRTLLVVHDSLLPLVCIKEKYDKVKCWQGELIYVPEKWTPFHVVFLYYLPALPFELNEIFEALAKRCFPGARIVISHPQGREALEKQRQQHPDIVVSDLPDKMTLQKVAADHSFDLAEFVDEPEFYLAVLKFCGDEK